MILLNGSGGQAGNTNTVAAHFKGLRFAVLVQEGRVHRAAVLGAQIEHMAHFDAALNRQNALAIGRGITCHHIAQVCHCVRLRQITAPVHAGDVEVRLVGTAHPVGHHRDLAVDHDLHGLLQPDGPQVPWLATKVVFNLRHGRETEVFQPGDFVDLDFVHVMVTAQQQQPDLRLDDLAMLVGGVGGQHQGFDGAAQGQAQQLRHIGTGALAGGGCLGHRLAGGRTWALRREGLGFFHVGSVVAARAVDDGVFARGGNHLKLFAQVTTDGTAVCGHRAIGQAEPVKNPAVGLCHDLVAGFGCCLVAVKRVSILHDELATTHQAKAWAALVAELGLDLVEVLGQLFVAAQFLPCNVCHHFFAGGLHHEVAAMAVADAQQLRPHLFKAPGFLPQLGRLNHRHGALHSPGPVHFLAHDGFHLADDPQPHGHVVIDARAQLLDQPRTHHEFVADHFGVCRSFLEGGDKELRGFHRGEFSLFRLVLLPGAWHRA